MTETAWPSSGLTAEADTLATVTARGNTTNIGITSSGGITGLSGEGTSWGTHGKDSNSGAYAYLGYDVYGVRSIGAGNYGLVSQDGDQSSYTHLNYANYGVYTNTPIYTASSVQGSQLCIGSDCRSAWPASGSNISCNWSGWREAVKSPFPLNCQCGNIYAETTEFYCSGGKITNAQSASKAWACADCFQ